MTDQPDGKARALLERCARLALEGVRRPFPYHLTHVFEGARSITSPGELTPVFDGCFDWHSAVHGHWLLARTARLLPDEPVGAQCREMLARQLNAESLQVEATYLEQHPAFERPYGLVWVLELACELQRFSDDRARGWREAIRPLERAAVGNLVSWLPKLTRPMRTGTHNQTAFGLCLLHDWAVMTGDPMVRDLVFERACTYFESDRDYALHLEPGGEDFFSPSLGAGWLMSKILPPDHFVGWLDRTMPDLGGDFEFLPAVPTDRADGRLAHLDGLNLSIGWMLDDIGSALPEDDPRRATFSSMAGPILERGREALSTGEYAGTHWLGTFAAYGLGVDGARFWPIIG